MPVDTIDKIVSASGLTREEIHRRIVEKRKELSELVSEEGAAFIVAKELGIEIKKDHETLRLENVVPGMQNVDILARITRIFPPREFSTKHGKGRVQNVFLSDSSGTLRMSLWNEEIESFRFKEGESVRVHGYVKEDNLGGPELRIGHYGDVEKSDIEIKVNGYRRKNIVDLCEGCYSSVRAPIIQVFESDLFFEVCPNCSSRLDAENKCKEHDKVDPDYRIVITGIIDDGTGSIRVVFFNEQAEAVLGMSTSGARKIFDRKKNVSAILGSIHLGKEFMLEGRVQRNSLFGRLEFIVNKVNEVDVKKEIRSFLGE